MKQKHIKKIISAVICSAMVLAVVSCSATGEPERTRRGDDDRRTTEAVKQEEGNDIVDPGNSIPGISGIAGINDTVEGPAAITTGPDFDPDFTFVTTDRDGNTCDESVFAQAKITMVNFWEPWCGPCVGEMPDLERLYEDYRDQGFQIIGVYSEFGMESDVDTILRDCGTSYPILHYTAEFGRFDSGYVPTTVFVDGQGHILTVLDGDPLIVGSKTYGEWESLIVPLL